MKTPITKHTEVTNEQQTNIKKYEKSKKTNSSRVDRR